MERSREILKIYIYRTAKIIIGLFMLIMVYRILFVLLVDDTESYTRVMFHELYSQDNIDVLFLGSSHTFQSFDTSVSDEMFGKNTFNAGSACQQLDGSYAILKEACKYNDVEEVYLDMWYMVGAGNIDSPTAAYIISDYLKPSFNRLTFLFKATSKEDCINGFFSPRRTWKKLFDGQYMADQYNRKKTQEYRDFAYITHDNEYYAGKGYIANTFKVPQYHNIFNEYFKTIADEPILPKNVVYIQNIIDFCREKGIKLTLVAAPAPDFFVYNVTNYDKYVNCVRDIAAKNNLDYYDFNLCRPEYFSGEDELFSDYSHLNKTGADIFTTLFCRLMTGQIREQDIFFDSYNEKISNIPYKVLGYFICKENDDTSDESRYFTLSAIDNIGQEYKISMSGTDGDGNEGEAKVIQNFSPNTRIELPADGHGKIYVELKYNDGFPDVITYNY